MFDMPAERMKETPAIIISEKRKRAAGSDYGVQILSHAYQTVVVPRRRVASQYRMEKEHIEGIDMVISRLFKVTAVVTHLSFHLALDHLCAGPFPRFHTEHQSKRM